MIRTEKRKTDKFSGYIHWTDGPQDLLELAQAGGIKFERASTWNNNENTITAFQRGSEGTERYVPSVDAMLNRINANMAIETSGTEFDNAVTGFMPDVPAAIQGFPESMIQLVDKQSDHAPVTVWVNTTMSGGFGAEEIARRGAACAALVMKLQAIRPVSLNVVVSLSHCHFAVMPIHARPLSIGQVSYLLSSAGWTRQVYNFLETFGAGGGWDDIFVTHNRKAQKPEYHKDTLEFLHGDIQHDVYIPPLFLHDELAERPVEWISERLSRYFKRED